MINNLPNWINVLFLIISIITVILFYFSNNKPVKITLLILALSFVQSILAYQDFYQNTYTTPPRFVMVLLPSLLLIVYGCLPKNIKWVKNHRNLVASTLLHSVRFPVEIILFYLFVNEMVPQIMTFQGFNFDILVGIVAPFLSILYWKKKLHTPTLLVFNYVGLIFVLTIFTIAILSSELPFQQLAFKQPNKAVNYFPFILLPALIVPIVIYTHITDIIKLSSLKKGTPEA